MKTKKSKKSKSGKKIKSSGSDPGLVLTAPGDYRDEDLEFWPQPTGWQLAQLAAQLACAGKADAKQLVHDAWDIYWEGCRKIQDEHQAQKAILEHESVTCAGLDENILQPEPVGPRPEKYPVTFLEMEILLLPGKKRKKRAFLIQEYVLSEFIGTCFSFRPKLRPITCWELDENALNKLREEFSGQVTAKLEHYRAQLFNQDAYVRFAESFLKWYRRYVSETRSAVASKRWDKEKENKKQSVPETNTAGQKKS